MSDPAIERPTLARHIYPGMVKKLEEAGNLQVGSTELAPAEEEIAIQLLQAMIAKTQELFPAGKAGEVDQAGQKVLREAIASKTITGDKAQAIWKALFQNPNNRYALIEAALMKMLCAGPQRPTLAGHIYPDMKVELSTFNVEGANLTADEVSIVEQMLEAMVVETQKLFPAAAAGAVDKAGQKVLRGAITRRKVTAARAQAIWQALFQTPNNLYKTVETSLMQNVCAPLFPSITGFSPPLVNPGTTTTITVLGENFPSDAKVEFLYEGAVDSSITVSPPTVAADGKLMTVTITVPATAKEGKRAIRISSAKYPQLSAVLPDGLEVKSAPSITSILPDGIFADGEPQPIRVIVTNLTTAPSFKLDVVDDTGKSIIGGEKEIAPPQTTVSSGRLIIGTLAPDVVEGQKVRITIPKETEAGTYYVVLKDAAGNEIARKAFQVHKITVPESWLKKTLRKGLNSETAALLNPELTVGAGASNFGLQDHEITGQHPLATNYPRGDFEQTPNWDIAARISPRLHLSGGGKVAEADFASASKGEAKKIWDALVKKGYIDQHGNLQSKFDGNRETFDLGIETSPEVVTHVFDVLQENSGTVQFGFEGHAGWQKFHSFGDAEGTNRLNTGAGVSLSTNQLIRSMQLVPRYSFSYNYSQNAEQYPSLAHPAGSEHAIENSLQLAWKPLRLFSDTEQSWLILRLGLAHQAAYFDYWKRTLGFEFDGWSQRLVLNGGLDLNFSELTPHWAVPNLSVNGAGTLWGYREVPDSLVESWKKRLTGWSGDGKLQWPRVWNTYLAGGYAEETSGGSIKLFHRWGGAGVMPPGWGTFDLRGGSTNNNPYYLTSKIYGELTWLPPEKLWFLPQLTAGGAQLHDQPADRTFPEVYGKAKYSVIDLIRKLVE